MNITESIKANGKNRVYNKTLLYLVPSLRVYGEFFRKILGTQSIITACVDDKMYNGKFQNMMDNIFIVFNMNKNGNEFLTDIRNLPGYRDDYMFNDLMTKRLHVVIFEYPHKSAYMHFIESQYSKMFTHEQIDEYYGKFATNIHRAGAEVLKHSVIGQSWFEYKIDHYLRMIAERKNLNEYRTHGWTDRTIPSISVEMEYEFPLVMEEEVLNYKATKKYCHLSYIELYKNIKDELNIQQIQETA